MIYSDEMKRREAAFLEGLCHAGLKLLDMPHAECIGEPTWSQGHDQEQICKVCIAVVMSKKAV